jgi:hypothetical protein
LKFKNRIGAIFHDADWIAGVDDDENIQQDTEDDKAYDDNENKDPEEDENINKEYNRINKDELEELIEDKKNKAIPTNIEKMKDKAKMKPREKKKNQKTMEWPSYANKKRTLKEANLKDLQERADHCRDSSLT